MFNSKKLRTTSELSGNIVAAKKAGVRVAAVTWGYNSQKALAKQDPDYVVNKPHELIDLFANALLLA